MQLNQTVAVAEAERLLEACAAGYVERRHPDVRNAFAILGQRAESILTQSTRELDALTRRVSGCYGTSRRR